MLEVRSTEPISDFDKRRLRGIVRAKMDAGMFPGFSASGTALGFAVEWCEEHKCAYRIMARPGVGYYLEVLGDTL